MSRIAACLLLFVGLAVSAIDGRVVHAAPPDALEVAPAPLIDASVAAAVQPIDAGSPAAAGSTVTPAQATAIAPIVDLPSALADESLIASLFRKGALIPASLVLAFVLLKLGSTRVPWLEHGYRATAIAAVLSALALVVPLAAQGLTPNIAQWLAAIGSGAALLLTPKGKPLPTIAQAGVAAALVGVLGMSLALAGISSLSACAHATAALHAAESCASADLVSAESQIEPTVVAALAAPATISTKLVAALVDAVPDAVQCAVDAIEAAIKSPAATSASPVDAARNAQILANIAAARAKYGWH